MCATVCPSEALWYGTIEQFDASRRGALIRDFQFGRQEVRTKVYTVVDDLEAGPLDVVGDSAPRLARRPLRTRRWLRCRSGEIWRRDFPYEAAAEEAVTRREFARYLVLGAGAMAAANVGFAMWTQLRSINTGEPRPIVALDEVAVGGHVLVPLPRAGRSRRVAPRSRSTGRGVQSEVHPPRVRRVLPSRREPVALPLSRGELRHAHRRRARRSAAAGARTHRCRDPRRRTDLGPRGERSRRAARAGRTTSSAVLVYVILLVAFQVFLITVAVEAFHTDNEARRVGDGDRLGRVGSSGRAVPSLPAPMNRAAVRDRDPVSRLLRARHGDGHRSRLLRNSSTSTGWPTSSTRSPPWPTSCSRCSSSRDSALYPPPPLRRSDEPRQGLRVPHDRGGHQCSGRRLRCSCTVGGAWRRRSGGLSLPLWVVLVYCTLFAVVLRPDKPGLEQGINGTWFLLTVSVESIAVLGRSAARSGPE